MYKKKKKIFFVKKIIIIMLMPGILIKPCTNELIIVQIQPNFIDPLDFSWGQITDRHLRAPCFTIVLVVDNLGQD